MKKRIVKKPKVIRMYSEALEYCGMSVGEHTSKEKQRVMFLMRDGFLNELHKMPVKEYRGFELLDDEGIKTGVYSNPSGGYFRGNYRTFLVRRKGKIKRVKFGLSDYVTDRNFEIVRTSLNVGVEDERKKHHSLQYVVDKNFKIIGNTYLFQHAGDINVGNLGRGKNQDVRDFMELERPGIVQKERIILGRINSNEKFLLDNPQITELIENFILYALVRDEYRKYRREEIENARKRK